MNNKKSFIVCYFVLHFCYSNLALAIDTKVLVKYPIEESIDFVTTPSRYREKPGDTPSTIIVVTQKQIQERGYLNLLQVLEDLPNIDIQRNVTYEGVEQISIRGIAKNNGFLILQDNIRINSPTGEPIRVNENYPIHYAKQIEIVYGPAAVMYGADALTAVINIISETAENIDGIEIKAIAEEHNSYSTYVKAGKQINENFAILAGGHFKDSDNANLAKYYPNDFILNDLTTFGGETVVKASDRVGYRGDSQSYSAFSKLTLFKNLDIGFNYAFDKHRSDASSKPDYADYGQNAYLNTEIGTAYIDYKFDFNNDLSGFLRANYSWYELAPESRFVNKFDDFTKTGGYKYAFGERKQIEGQLEYKINSEHKVSGGFSLEDYYSIPKTTDLNAPYDSDKSPDEQSLYYLGTDNTLPVKIQYESYNNIAAYLQWNAKWHDMLSTSIAFRYDENSRYGSTFNPKLGLVFKPTDEIIAKFLYGSAFLAPSMYYAGQHFGSFSGKTGETYTSGFFMLPNSDLKPETIDTFEFNFDYRITQNLNIGLNLYYNNLKDIISWEPTPEPVTDYIPGGFIRYTEHQANIGEATSYGGDLHFNYRYYFSDSILKLWGSYSYLDGELSRAGQNYTTDLPLISKHKVKLGLTYTYLNKYTLTSKFYWVDEINSTRTEANHPDIVQTIAPYWRVDLYANAKIDDSFSLFLNVTNLFDKRYYNPGFFASSMFESPQDPRTISGGFTVKF